MAYILHEYAASGNCYKVRLTAAHAGIPLERREYDITAGATRTEAFLSEVNANGRIPVLQVGNAFLPESNAAALYLADGSPLIPEDRLIRADMLRWMFWEQYNHEPNIATLRFWRTMIGEDNLAAAQRAAIPAKEAAGHAALTLLDEHLARADWLVGGHFTLADVVLFAYSHVAEEGGFALDRYPAMRRWLVRVATQPGHIALSD